MTNHGKFKSLDERLRKEENDKLTATGAEILKCLEKTESSMIQDCVAAMNVAEFLLRQVTPEQLDVSLADAIRVHTIALTEVIVRHRKSQITKSN